MYRYENIFSQTLSNEARHDYILGDRSSLGKEAMLPLLMIRGISLKIFLTSKWFWDELNQCNVLIHGTSLVILDAAIIQMSYKKLNKHINYLCASPKMFLSLYSTCFNRDREKCNFTHTHKKMLSQH